VWRTTNVESCRSQLRQCSRYSATPTNDKDDALAIMAVGGGYGLLSHVHLGAASLSDHNENFLIGQTTEGRQGANYRSEMSPRAAPSFFLRPFGTRESKTHANPADVITGGWSSCPTRCCQMSKAVESVKNVMQRVFSYTHSSWPNAGRGAERRSSGFPNLQSVNEESSHTEYGSYGQHDDRYRGITLPLI